MLPLLLAVVGGTLAWLKSDIRDLRAEIRTVDAKVDALTQTLLTSALARSSLIAPPEAAVPQRTTKSRTPPAG